MEELVALHDTPLGIEDLPDAQSLVVTRGEIAFEHVTFWYGGHPTPLYRDLDLPHPLRRKACRPSGPRRPS